MSGSPLPGTSAGRGAGGSGPAPHPRPGPPAGGPPPARKPVPRLARVDETSAGGLVVDRENRRAALIARHDRRGKLVWSLPKGHVEPGETPEDAAVREVEEETGIRGRVIAPLGTIDFWFVAEQRRVHKTVHHYLLEAECGELSDADVEVDQVAWVPLDEVAARLAYADERRLLEKVDGLLADPTGPGA
jgi:ADP-ribose pyrophosphatase YjhB (NUDIX family)